MWNNGIIVIEPQTLSMCDGKGSYVVRESSGTTGKDNRWYGNLPAERIVFLIPAKRPGDLIRLKNKASMPVGMPDKKIVKRS